MMRIAVFVDPHGEIAPLFTPGVVRVFTRCGKHWQPVRDIPYELCQDMGLEEIRTRTLTMLAELAACRHFVALNIHGALLAWFDGMGITMWKCRGMPDACLTAIHDAVGQRPRERVAVEATFIQAGTDDGEYHINLMTALASDAGLTSKQLLLPFLQDRGFTRLDVICDHLPKWFTQQLPALNLVVEVEQQPQGYLLATIHPATGAS
ncbi:Fe-only nitrogenase accessory protein AnfO [Brenneria roseae subsp. americana]|uniref:Fe-only nitrogenase accessory protein AnfO n=1 Tax=Brenneria roseae subsp. americana TaxID=1508507 RepID=A0A2U1U2B3_9GAMM|nr:Fe-only nitrogenase accessory protein AnfO [Brenneria roseae]PWC15816.1 Fe-only nitrogenase accessory protein AnfO [Brenneria roseae subsp. americana]